MRQATRVCHTCVLPTWTFSLPLFCAFCSLSFSFLLCKFNHLTPMKYKSRQWRKNFLPNRQNLSLLDDAIRRAQKLFCMESKGKAKEVGLELEGNWFFTWTRSLHEHINAHHSRTSSFHSLHTHSLQVSTFCCSLCVDISRIVSASMCARVCVCVVRHTNDKVT